MSRTQTLTLEGIHAWASRHFPEDYEAYRRAFPIDVHHCARRTPHSANPFVSFRNLNLGFRLEAACDVALPIGKHMGVADEYKNLLYAILCPDHHTVIMMARLSEDGDLQRVTRSDIASMCRFYPNYQALFDSETRPGDTRLLRNAVAFNFLRAGHVSHLVPGYVLDIEFIRKACQELAMEEDTEERDDDGH